MTAFHAYLFTVIAPILTASDGAARLFAPGGALLTEGLAFRNPDFADALEAIGREGPRLFTEGEIAQAMIAQSRQLGGHLTLDDLTAYRVERRAPLSWRHGHHEICLNPPPAAGGPLLAVALALLGRDRDMDAPPAPVDLARVMAETNRVRAGLGARLEALSDRAPIAAALAALAAHAEAPRGTTHISVIDADGNAAAASLSNGEGNGHIVPGCGFMLNNMLGEEDLSPSGFHAWPPGRRLSSMMAPTVIADGDGAVTAMGSGGSNRIRSALLQVIVNLTDRRLPLEEAVAAPRLHLEKCGTLSFEDRFSAAEREALLAAYPDAQVWPEPNMFFGGVHTARRAANGHLEGVGDPRRRGVALLV